MTGPEPLDCAAVRLLAPELALGIVSGPERGEAIAHLERCPACRATVDELAGATDALVLLAPHAEPSPGFELAVLDRMRGAPRRTGRREVAAWVLAAACVLALVGVLLAGPLVGGDGGDGGGGGGRGELAVLRASSGRVVGEALLYPSRGEHPAWMYLSMPGWIEWVEDRALTGDHRVRVTMDDGSEQVVDLPPLEPDLEGWGGALAADPDQVASVEVIDADGRVLCSTAA